MNTEKVLHFFREITRIPRESGHEEKIVAYLQQFAKERGLECKTDKIGNVMIAKPASKGYEDRPTVVLQGHTDMVCEKKSTSNWEVRIFGRRGRLVGSQSTRYEKSFVGGVRSFVLLICVYLTC